MAEMFIVHDESILIPTFEEFRNFKNYMGYLDENYFDPGFARIRAPPEWIGQWDAVSSIPSSLSIKPIKQLFQRNDNGYLISALPTKPRTMTLGDYIDQVSKTERHFDDINEYEKEYWANLTTGHALYAADIDFSLCRKIPVWNLNSLKSILDLAKTPSGEFVSGIHTPYCYVGSWMSSFGWHTEDYDAYSINVHLHGKPKVWYFIPREDGLRFDNIVSTMYPEFTCAKFLRHKMCLFGSDFFEEHKIKRIRVVQSPGDIIITFPYIFHSGFNCGLNYNEAVNFATRRWIEYGKNSGHCSCKSSKKRPSFHIELNLDPVVKRHQTWKFDSWKDNKDEINHPDDPAVREMNQLASDKLRDNTAKKFAENVTRRTDESLLPPEVVLFYLRFIINNEVGIKSVKTIRKFKKYANNHKVYIPTMNDSTLLSRFMKQAYEKVTTDEDTFGLTKNEIDILKRKLKQ